MAERPPRLLWVHQYFAGSGAAGSDRAVITLEGFLSRGWEVRIIGASTGYQDGGVAPAEGMIGKDSCHRDRIALRWSGPDARARSYLEFFWRGLAAGARGFRPDLVFCTSPPLTQTLQARLLARRWQVPIVLEIRDLWPTFLEELGLVRSPLLLAALRRMEQAAYRAASAVVSASPAFRPYLLASGVAPDSLFEAPHGARLRDLAALRDEGRKFRALHGLGQRPVILYAGALHNHYGLDTWLPAATALAAARPDLLFVVAGGGREKTRIEAAARASANLLYLGTVPRAELDGAVAAADIGLVCLSHAPSFVSVLPGKLVDLLSCAVPVVTTIGGQAARLVERSGAGWVAPNNSIALVKALNDALDAGRAERRRRGIAGCDFVLRHLSAEAQADAVADACRWALARPASAGRSLLHARSLRSPHSSAMFRDGGEQLAVAAFDDWLSGRV